MRPALFWNFTQHRMVVPAILHCAKSQNSADFYTETVYDILY